MYKEIPFYGKKDSIKSIKELDDNYFEICIYDKDGSVNNSKVIVTKEQMLKNYRNAIDAYLFYMKDRYDEAKKIIESGVIKKSCIKMFIISVAAGIGIPMMGYFMNSAFVYYLGFVITGVMCVPTFFYSLKELMLKSSEKEIGKSIKEYEDLVEERNVVNEELRKNFSKSDKTKFRSIERMKQEVKENNKKLVRERE